MRTPCLSLPRIVLLSAALSGFCAGPAIAESACKGLEQAACESNADCTWNAGYTRKDGKQVAPYCKAKGKRAAGGASPAAAPAAPPKAPQTPPK